MPTKFDAYLADQVEEHMQDDDEDEIISDEDPADDEPASDYELMGCCP